MFMDRERFGEKICNVGFTSDPRDLDFVLADAIADPMETEVDGLGAFYFKRFVGETDGACVVAED
jgi:hypothetical protein